MDIKPLEDCERAVEEGFVVVGTDLLLGLRRQIDTPDAGRKWAGTLLMSDILDFSMLAVPDSELAAALWDLAGGDAAAARRRLECFVA